jgi:hypothetical protein
MGFCSWGGAVSLGAAERQGSLLNDVERFCEEALAENSIYAVLHRERDRLFPTRCSLICSVRRDGAVAAVGGCGGDGPATAGRTVGPGGGGALQFRCTLPLGGRGGQLRLRGVGQFRSYRAGRLPRSPGGVG